MNLLTLDLDTQQVKQIPRMVLHAHRESSELSELRED